MGLAQDRFEFGQCLHKLFAYAYKKGYRLVPDEGRVFQDRVGKIKMDGPSTGAASVRFSDRVHIKTSKHYSGLAQDSVLYDDQWRPITQSSAEWQDLGKFWKTLHPRCSWGGDFAAVDLNHFSWDEK